MEENVEEKNISKKYKIKERIKTISIILLLFIILAYASTNTEQQNLDLKEQIENLSNTQNHLISNNRELENKIEEMRKLQSTTSDINNEKDKQISNLQKGNQELFAQKEDLEKSNNNLQNKNQQLEEQIKNLENEKLNLVSEINSLKSQVNVHSTESKSSTPTQTSSQDNSTSYSVYITDTGSKYHRSSCSYLKKSKHKINKNDAVSQGYTACSRCNP